MGFRYWFLFEICEPLGQRDYFCPTLLLHEWYIHFVVCYKVYSTRAHYAKYHRTSSCSGSGCRQFQVSAGCIQFTVSAGRLGVQKEVEIKFENPAVHFVVTIVFCSVLACCQHLQPYM